MKVTKYNKVYEVSEQEIEKWINIFTDMLKMNEDGEYTGPVAAEAVRQEEIDKEIKQLKEKIKKLTGWSGQKKMQNVSVKNEKS